MKYTYYHKRQQKNTVPGSSSMEGAMQDVAIYLESFPSKLMLSMAYKTELVR